MTEHVLFLISTGKQELQELSTIVASFSSDELPDALHIREKHRGARELAHWYEELHKQQPKLPLYMNDRLDTALAVKAPGVQLGYNSLSVSQARRILPQGTRIGVSIHSLQEALQAADEGADYVLFGHIYPTSSKAGLEPRGVQELAKVVEGSPLPVVAIGGIEPVHVDEVLATGCAGIAVLSGVLLHDNPTARLRSYRSAIRDWSGVIRVPWYS